MKRSKEKVMCLEFETIGVDAIVLKCKVSVLKTGKYVEYEYISDIVKEYAKVKYGADIDWDDYYRAFLIIEGVPFKLDVVTKHTMEDDENEIFEYRKDTLVKVIKECVKEIDEVYSVQSSKNKFHLCI